jgi:hypothetical protein
LRYDKEESFFCGAAARGRKSWRKKVEGTLLQVVWIYCQPAVTLLQLQYHLIISIEILLKISSPPKHSSSSSSHGRQKKRRNSIDGKNFHAERSLY